MWQYTLTMIYLGSDHGGFVLKEKIKLWLTEWGYSFEDMGALALDPTDDYPDFAFTVARKVVESPENRGVLLCRSGGGMVIAANKIKGIRAASVYDEKSAKHGRTNDDVNIISLAGDWMSEAEAKTAVHTFLLTPFSNEERHVRRLQKIENV